MIKLEIQKTPYLVLKAVALLCLVSIVTGAIPGVQAEALSRAPAVSASALASGPSDPEEMEAFLDDFFESRMTKLHVPGAAIVVVRDGKVFLSQGYGYADLARRTPVDPTRTAFRAGWMLI